MPGMFTRREFIVATSAAALTGCKETVTGGSPDDAYRDPAETALRRGAEWLWHQMDKNGAFKSKVYGIMAGGKTLTPLSILTLSAVPSQLIPWRAPAGQRCMDWILASVDSSGAVGMNGPASDYPVYATSLAILATAKLRPDRWRDRIRPMTKWLQSQQFRSTRGWAGHPAQGGFGMGASALPDPPNSGHVDLSMTRYALQALDAADAIATAGQQAEAFLTACQTSGGGFIYSPVEPALNKGERSEHEMYGYGTSTADGILAMIAAGYPRTDKRLVQAYEYLQRIHTPDQNPAVGTGPYQGYALAMKGYYRAASSSVFELLGGPPGWHRDMMDVLFREQRGDGSWKNDLSAQKEDDPLISTGFALQALSIAYRQLKFSEKD